MKTFYFVLTILIMASIILILSIRIWEDVGLDRNQIMIDQEIEIAKLEKEIDLREEVILEEMMKAAHLRVDFNLLNFRKVVATFYVPHAGGLNSDSDPSNTACMTTPKSGVHIAVSRDMKDWLGARVYLDSKDLPNEYRGIRFVHGLLNDTLPDGTPIRGQIDIVCPNVKEAFRLGKIKGVTIRRIYE